jgi:reactive intermediate/imine deaminase
MRTPGEGAMKNHTKSELIIRISYDRGGNEMKRSREREEIKVADLNEPISHYTDAVRFGHLLFISGMAPVDKDLNLVGGGDVARQTRQVLENMKKVMDHVGADFSDVLKVTVYLTDIDDRHAINPVRREFFGDARPASTLIGVDRLALDGMKVEIEAIVGLPD